jgi:Leucine-rich repeat (LRR) protein
LGCGKLTFGILQDIENLDDLTALEELWLGKNKITEIKVYLDFSRALRRMYN